MPRWNTSARTRAFGARPAGRSSNTTCRSRRRSMTQPRPAPFFPASADFAAGRDTPREFLERCLARLGAWEPTVGAFVCHDAASARAAADRSAARWRDGRPLSTIDGMPLGIKDIIETADMPTEQGSPLFVGWRTSRDAASVAALREAGAVILGKVVTTEFAATEPRGTRNPWDRERTPGGSSSGSAAAVGCGMVPAALGTQVVGSILRPASFCGCVGFKPSVGGINRGGSYDYFSQSCTGVLAATLEDAWLVAVNIAARAGGDPGYPGLQGPDQPPPPRRPRALAVLQTCGWGDAAPEARAAFESAVASLADAGVALADRGGDPVIEEVEGAIADAAALTRAINAWEGRWPLNTYRDRDAGKLSRPALDRLATAEAMTLAEYGGALAVRQRNRESYARLAGRYDGAITLAAPGTAPLGLHSTGNPVFNVPASLLGIPAVSLPLLSIEGLPLGLQVAGFIGEDARLFAVAAAIRDLLVEET
ncbi:MAG TPA: amidase [Stellaceae bacterium]|nr:amidase [Stellaceae bacterium]